MKQTEGQFAENLDMFFRRFAAYFIDQVIIISVMIMAVVLLVLPFWLEKVSTQSTAFGVAAVITFSIYLFGSLCYYSLSEYFHGRTIGKKVLHLNVVVDAKRLILLRIFGRNVTKAVPFVSLLLVIDIFGILFTKKQQRFTEMLAKTRVVKEKSK